MTHRSSGQGEPGDWDWDVLRTTCWREAKRVLGSVASAEDVAQEAAIKAWRHRASCRRPERPLPWVAAIAHREALRAIAAPRCEPLDRAPEALVGAPEPSLDLVLDVRRACAELPEPDRRLLLARYWQDLTHQEAAELLGMPDGTAKVRLHRIRSRLRPALREP
jgi:RNA polymerase sigma-70 factor (ECF subfamily)